ncbi:MAG: cytochrome c [Hyphomicrobiaceae bacterium]|nr:cytochrome c [Hyphomicrobiaceae bacterium]
MLKTFTLTAAVATFATATVAAESSQVAEGKSLFVTYCSTCHGADGQRGEGFQTPIWGPGSQIRKFGHAQGLFEYLQVMMPFDDPSKIDDQARWKVLAYMLERHKAIAAGGTLDPAQAAMVPIE